MVSGLSVTTGLNLGAGLGAGPSKEGNFLLNAQGSLSASTIQTIRDKSTFSGAGALSATMSGPLQIKSQLAGSGFVSVGPPYVTKAVHFDGATVVGLKNTAAGLAANAPTGLVSVWVKGADFFNNAGQLFNTSLFIDWNAGNVQVTTSNSEAANSVFLSLSDTGFVNEVEVQVLTGFSTTNWTWLGFSWDTNHAAGLRKTQIFYGDAAQSLNTFTDNGVAFSCPYTDSQWFLGSGPSENGDGTHGVLGDEADFQMWCGIPFVDLTVTANRRLFIDGNGRPVNPNIATAALGAQTVLLSGDSASFPINQGSGGATGVLSGTLTNATTSPST